MSTVTMRQMLEAGVHFGHRTSRWNPKMRPYIFTSRNGVHVIDLAQTKSMLDEALDAIRDAVASGEKVLFVGTKKQAQDVIREVCDATGQHYVVNRWLGGMLTNYPVMRQRVRRLQELRELKERGDFERMSRKEANVHQDELTRLESNFGGLATMDARPGVLFVIDCKRESLAVKEANTLSIPIYAIVDTNCDPDKVEYVIPGNDDSMRAISLILTAVQGAIEEGMELQRKRKAEASVRETSGSEKAVAVAQGGEA